MAATSSNGKRGPGEHFNDAGQTNRGSGSDSNRWPTQHTSASTAASSVGVGVGADSADMNTKQPGEKWSVQLVAQYSECADDVDEGHTCVVLVVLAETEPRDVPSESR